MVVKTYYDAYYAIRGEEDLKTIIPTKIPLIISLVGSFFISCGKIKLQKVLTSVGIPPCNVSRLPVQIANLRAI